MVAGGRPSAASDTPGEAKGTWLLFLFIFTIGAVMFVVFNPSLSNFADFMRQNWYWVLGIGVMLLFAYRAFQGQGLFPNLRSLSIKGGGGGSVMNAGGGGGGGLMKTIKTVVYLLLFIVVLFLLMKIFMILGLWEEKLTAVYEWRGWPWQWW